MTTAVHRVIAVRGGGFGVLGAIRLGRSLLRWPGGRWRGFLGALGLVLGLGVQAHNLDQRMVYVQYSQPTLDLMAARARAGLYPLLQPGDKVGLMVKSTPGPGTLTGAGGYITIYIPAGMRVVCAEYGRADASMPGGFRDLPMKGPSIMPIGAGPIGARATVELSGLVFTDVNGNGIRELPVVAGTGLHRGTIAGVYAEYWHFLLHQSQDDLRELGVQRRF